MRGMDKSIAKLRLIDNKTRVLTYYEINSSGVDECVQFVINVVINCFSRIPMTNFRKDMPKNEEHSGNAKPPQHSYVNNVQNVSWFTSTYILL